MQIDNKPALESQAISVKLQEIIEAAPAEKVSIEWLLSAFEARAFSLFLLILALPCCLPFVYGLPQIVSVPLLLLSLQLAWGRHTPWLPERLRQKQFSVAAFARLIARINPYLRFFEKFSQPRWAFLTYAPASRVIGGMLVIFSCSIMLPFPMTNTVPGIAVALVSLGFLQRDGILTLGGVLLGIIWVGFLLSLFVLAFDQIFNAGF